MDKIIKIVIIIVAIAVVAVMTYVSFINMSIQEVQLDSAQAIANSETSRIAMLIDDTIGFRGANEYTVNLQSDLKVGSDIVPYTIEIDDAGLVTLMFDAPYEGVSGHSQFGINLQRISGSDKISCDWDQIKNGASINVNKVTSNVTIDASEGCGESMVLQERSAEA